MEHVSRIKTICKQIITSYYYTIKSSKHSSLHPIYEHETKQDKIVAGEEYQKKKSKSSMEHVTVWKEERRININM